MIFYSPIYLQFNLIESHYTDNTTAATFNMLNGLGSFPFARHYLGNHSYFLFLQVLRCFSSPGWPHIAYGFSYGLLDITLAGLSHSEIRGYEIISI